MSREVSGGRGKPIAPERWPESSRGALEQRLRLTSAIVNDALRCACLGACGAGRDRSRQVQGGLWMCREGQSSRTVA